jgi:hypothetical protein
MTTTTIPGKHRSWTIRPRIGTGPEDRYTLLGAPIPGDGNPAEVYEDGEFSSWQQALEALLVAERVDDGTHQPEPIPRFVDMKVGSTFVAQSEDSYAWRHWAVTSEGAICLEGRRRVLVPSSIQDYRAPIDLPERRS